MSGAPLSDSERQMREIVARGGDDPEADHTEADAILVRMLRVLGYGQLCDDYAHVKKWYA